jgi:hypothetical protein
MATNGNINHDQYAAPAQTADAPASADGSTNNLPKDEVGWYFVEQYYTTMSKSPERLHVSLAPCPCWYAAQLTIRTAVLWQEGTVRLRSRGGGRECFFRQTGEYPLLSDHVNARY